MRAPNPSRLARAPLPRPPSRALPERYPARMTSDDTAFHDELAALAARGAVLPAVRLIMDRTGLSTAEAKRFHDDFVANRGIVVDPTALEIQAALHAELQEPDGL